MKVINEKCSSLAKTIPKHATEVQAAGKRLDEAEARPLAVENSTAVLEPRIAELEKQVSALTERLDMAENYNRHPNIRVVSLAEDTEAGQPVEFIESWLPRVLMMTTKAGCVNLERAHHTLAPKPDPNRSPRSLLLQFHTFKDKQRLMEAAHQASQDGGLIYNGSRISFYSNFFAMVMKNGKTYDAVKQRLQEQGIPYAMLFPATLGVTHGSSQKRFSTPLGGTRLH